MLKAAPWYVLHIMPKNIFFKPFVNFLLPANKNQLQNQKRLTYFARHFNI